MLRYIAYKPESPSEAKVLATVGSHIVWRFYAEQQNAQHQLCWIATAHEYTRREAIAAGKQHTDEIHWQWTPAIVETVINRNMRSLTKPQMDTVVNELARRWQDLWHKSPQYALNVGDLYRRIYARNFATAIEECRLSGMQISNIREAIEEATASAKHLYRLAPMATLREDKRRGR